MTSKEIILTPKVREFVFEASHHWLNRQSHSWIHISFLFSLAYIYHHALKGNKKEDTAVDQGGPSRQFLTDVFKQIEVLSVKVGNARVSLFENTNSGVIVVTDDMLENSISIAAKTSSAVLSAKDEAAASKRAKKAVASAVKRAKDYVRAIGRIMLHSMANEYTLPSKAMSPFFMTGEKGFCDFIILCLSLCTHVLICCIVL